MNEQQAGLYDYNFVHLIACCNRDNTVLAASMPLSRIIINILFTAAENPLNKRETMQKWNGLILIALFHAQRNPNLKITTGEKSYKKALSWNYETRRLQRLILLIRYIENNKLPKPIYQNSFSSGLLKKTELILGSF